MPVFSKSFPYGKAPDISTERKRELLLFQKLAEIKFKSLDLLNLAFCHRSYANESQSDVDNNERLEFLGDSVLGLVVADWLFVHLPGSDEGDFSRIKSFVVSEESLAEIAKHLRVDNFILIGKGEEFSGGRNKKALLADCMEAIFGAYFLDSGFKAATDLVQRLLVPVIRTVLDNKHRKDYKTLLQEHVQKRYKTYPRYEVVKRTGPEHDNTFWVKVIVQKKTFGPASGNNKKEGEQAVAKIAYEELVGE
ncbi:MAG: ribonuclease III [Sphaerochaetaceae bacterium]|jgi:ribonuclease-3|nr:ribonuclease III [Sphaerochaetaceae bacterium]MDD3942489.1 ribonuclease III [Sphaerochaetaceae bacterium]MDX9938589.1 ribonuclease III [Sphaerochaetaceae bacterium]